MERETQRKYPIFDQLSTEELEALLVQDFAVTDEEPDVDYIMAIMEVIAERKSAAGRQIDVDAAWNDFQENYQGQAAVYDHTVTRETESSDHHTTQTQVTRKKTRVFRYALVAAAIIVLLCGTASGFGRVFQAVVNWTAETFGFEAPYGATVEESLTQEDIYADLRAVVAEYTDVLIVPKWASAETKVAPDIDVQKTTRKDSVQITGVYESGTGRITIRIRIHNEMPVQYTFAYQWEENQGTIQHESNGLTHEIIANYENNVAVWTNGNVECMIQGDLSVDELKQMIDSIYEE